MRLFSTLITVLPLTLASPLSAALDEEFAEPSALEPRVVPAKPPHCSDTGLHIIGTGGNANTNHGYGLLITLVNAIKEEFASFPGVSHSYSVPYPRQTGDPPVEAMLGVQNLTEYLQYYTEGCPDTPIVLLGYSLGAIVTLNTLCGRSHIGAPYSPPISSAYAPYIIATIVYGDETRIPNQPYNLGTCINGEGVDPRGNPSGCAAFEDNFQSYCDIDDPECCNGTIRNAHFEYPKKYNTDAVNFIIQQFNAFHGNKTSKA